MAADNMALGLLRAVGGKEALSIVFRGPAIRFARRLGRFGLGFLGFRLLSDRQRRAGVGNTNILMR